MTRGSVRDHIASAILEAAAAVIAEQGDSASMSDVAEAAGIGRATLYRYFASREDLLRALSAAAVDDASARLAAADLDLVPVPEALARMARAMLACGTTFSVIVDEPQYIDRDDLLRRVGQPIRAVLRRGMDDGTLRDDLPLEVLAQLWGGLLSGAIRSIGELDNGVERAGAAVSSLFLHGAEGPTAG
jgi:AcrR family transcriptional regulator